MNTSRKVLIGILSLCSVVGFVAPASADESPCPAHVPFFLAIYIANGLGNWPFQEWYEESTLLFTEGSGTAAECYYVGERWNSHPYAELQDPNYQWHANYLAVLAQSM